MKKAQVDVKSKGNVIGQVTITVFESMQEADKVLGAKKSLEFVNRQYKADTMNEFRGNATRTVSSTAQLKKLGEKDPTRKAQIESLLKKYQEEDDKASK